MLTEDSARALRKQNLSKGAPSEEESRQKSS